MLISRDRHEVKGNLRWTGPREFCGFVIDPSDLTEKLVVEMLIDGFSVRTTRADEYVDELAQSHVGDGCYGFSFSLPQEILEGARRAEVRIANLDVPVGSPIVFDRRGSDGRHIAGPGLVRWLGGLRFAGWLQVGQDDPALEVIVDGTHIMRVTTSGWSHDGSSAEKSRPVRTFSFHLPETFADGVAKQLTVRKANGDPLAGSPTSFVAFPGGLAETHARLGIGGRERRGAELLDRLFPSSFPFDHYPAWREDATMPKRASSKRIRAAIVVVGKRGRDHTLKSLTQQCDDNCWPVLCSDSVEPMGFKPDLVRTFLEGDAKDCDFVVFGLSGTVLNPIALTRIDDAFLTFQHARIVYGDVEIVSSDGSLWPLAFGSFDYERMLEQGYGAHFFALRLDAARQALNAGSTNLYRVFNAILDDGDVDGRVVHVPGALATLPAIDLLAAVPTLEAATARHLEQRQVKCTITPARGEILPAVRVRRSPERQTTSVLIIARNRLKSLKECFESIQATINRRTFELIVANGGVPDPLLTEYLHMIGKRGARVTSVANEFNAARLTNIAVAAATGENVCILDSGIRALNCDWLEEMLGRLSERNVGAVGAVLVQPNGFVEHGGIVLGPGFSASHAFGERPYDDPGYGDLLRVTHESSAVSGACLVTRRSDYLNVGGMDELRFPMMFNDVDYCLKLRASGKRIVLTPHARLLHAETRGVSDDTARGRSLVEREQRNLRAKWGAELSEDPYYNPMLALDLIPFSALAWSARNMSARVLKKPIPRACPPGF